MISAPLVVWDFMTSYSSSVSFPAFNIILSGITILPISCREEAHAIVSRFSAVSLYSGYRFITLVPRHNVNSRIRFICCSDSRFLNSTILLKDVIRTSFACFCFSAIIFSTAFCFWSFSVWFFTITSSCSLY